jgi:hypothetical protein
MGRVVVAGTWKLLTLDIGDNARLVKNLLTWLSSRSGSTDAMVADAGARGAALAPGVELGPFGDREIIDPHASQVIGELRSIHRRLQTPSLPMRDLFGELDILFDRKTFRNEAVSECTSQGWSDRLHAAYQTVEILRAYQRNVRDAGTREQYDNYRKVVDDVDDYAMNMSTHLFQPAVRYEDIREHIGSKEFYARLPPERKFPIGQNGKLELPAPIAAACDPHRKRAGDHMRRLYDSVR